MTSYQGQMKDKPNSVFFKALNIITVACLIVSMAMYWGTRLKLNRTQAVLMECNALMSELIEGIE